MGVSFTSAFTVEQSPAEVFAAVNNVRGWWTGDIDGDTVDVGDEFTYRYQDLHRSTQRVTESVPGKGMTWQVIDGYLQFVADKTEWTGTTITFDITPVAGARNCASPTSACTPNPSATRTAPVPGAFTSTAASET